jgi:hypothetical protein
VWVSLTCCSSRPDLFDAYGITGINWPHILSFMHLKDELKPESFFDNSGSAFSHSLSNNGKQ